MGHYSGQIADEVRLERMRPEQIGAALAKRAAIYMPFGAMEWHGYHNPVGLDCLKAHEQLVGLAIEAVGSCIRRSTSDPEADTVTGHIPIWSRMRL